MAKRYQKDIKVVLPKSNPFRDIAVYGAGEEIIKALGGELADKGKQPGIKPSSNSPYFNTKVNPTKQSPIELHQEIYRKANYTPYVPTPEELSAKASGRLEQSSIQPEDLLMLGLSAKNLFKAQSLMNNAKQPIMVQGFNLAHPRTLKRAQQALNKAKGQALAEGTTQAIDYAYGGPINNTDNMKKSNKKGQSPRSILSPEQRMAMQFGWGGALGTVLGTGAALGLTALTGGLTAPLIPAIAGAGASIGGSLGSNIEQGIDKNKQVKQPQFQQPQQYQQPIPQQMQFAKGGMLNKRGIPHRGTSEQMPYQTQMQSYPNLEFGNGEQMLANGGQLEDTEFAEGGIHIKPSKRGTFTAAATKHGKSVQGFASQVLANKENYSPAMVKKANFARNAAKWKHAEGGFLNEPAEGVIERRNKNRSREPQEYATFEENFKHMYAQGGRMGAMGPMDVSKIYYADGGKKQNDPESINHLQWGKYIDDPKRREQHIVDVYQNLMDSRWDPKDIDQFMKEAGGYGSKSRGDMVKSGSVWGWDHEDITNEVLGKAWDDYYNRSNTPTKLAAGGMLNHYNGYSHENGGIPIGPNAEVEGGETSMKMGMGGEQNSTYIYSDRLKVPGKNYTFADGSKKIDSKYSRRTNDKLSDESKKRELNKLMESQEQERAGLVNSAYETIAAYGGPIRKYVLGGGTDPVGKTTSYFDFNEVNPAAGDMMTKDSYFDFNDPNNQADSEYNFNKMPAGYKTDFRKRQILGLPFVEDTEYTQNIENRINADINADINPEPGPKKLNFIQRAQQNKQNKRLQKYESNPNTSLENRPVNKDFTQAEIDELMGEQPMASNVMSPNAAPSNAVSTVPNQYNIPVSGIASKGNTFGIPDLGGARSTVNPDGSITSDSGFGTGEQWAKGIGYGLQGAGLLARQLQLSSKKNKLRPNKAFTMERQLLNADPQLREADISAAIANRNIRDLGASTSSGGAMAGYLAAQAGRTRSKADIMADLQNRQAQVDMTTGQYNAMAGERASDKDAADLAAQQTSQAQLFADMSKLGSGVTRDYLLGQSQEGLMGSMKTPEYGYKKRKGRNRYDRYYLNEDIG